MDSCHTKSYCHGTVMSPTLKYSATAKVNGIRAALRNTEVQNGQIRLANCLYHLIRAALAAVFIWSGFTKLIAPQSFSLVIEAYGLLPDALVYPAALGLSALELIAGVGLLFDSTSSLAVITALSMLFILVLSYGLYLGLDVDCGCFSPEDPEGQAHNGLRPALYRDLVMMAVIAYLYVWRYRRSWQSGRVNFFGPD